MTGVKQRFYGLSDEARREADETADLLCRRWHQLCELYLPVRFEDSIWRLNRSSKPQEPSQGWKLHISATILEACDLFERVAPVLISADVQFKAPKSLDELSKLNCGLYYGYRQIGKFITIYPPTEKRAVELARRLHELTKGFFTISVPFDEQYLPESSVFYRYGAFSNIKATDENGKTIPAITNAAGELVLDDRRRAVPAWLADPFPGAAQAGEKNFADTPLGTTYRVFRAITQRGKGGTYQAIALDRSQPRLCIVKEGRRNGELGWNGQDGYSLVRNEFEVLSLLKKEYAAVPQVFSSFELYGNFYFAMEYVEGKSLNDIIKPRRRRLSVKQTLKLALEITKIIERIHRAGWIWNDCKPANLIVADDNSLRPIDFENAYPADRSELFEWKSRGFSRSPGAGGKTDGKSADLYALGAVVYFLLTGRLFHADKPVAISKLRRNVPRKLIEITEKLLFESDLDTGDAGREFEKILKAVS